MSLVVNTNIASMNVQRSLASSSRDFQTSMERLSSGKKINSASDDAAGFAIAERMTTQITGLNRAVANVNDGLSLLNIAQATGREAIDVLQRMRELTVQGLSGTNSAIDKENLQLEFETWLQSLRILVRTRSSMVEQSTAKHLFRFKPALMMEIKYT